MNKSFCIFFCFFCFFNSVAQDTVSKRWNVKASYTAGLQSLRLNGVEDHIRNHLRRYQPSLSNFEGISFPVTPINQISLSASVFKNKKWFLHLDAFWGNNYLTTKGYSVDANDDIYIAEGKTSFKFIYTGYSLSRQFKLNKWGVIAPFIGFYVNWKTYYHISSYYQVNDKSSNEKLYSGQYPSNTGNPYRYGSPYILWLLDNPKLGLNYEVKLLNHTYLNLSYSYWFGNTYANELYGLSNNYIIKRTNRPLTKENKFHDDLYSHNISVGLTFKLLK